MTEDKTQVADDNRADENEIPKEIQDILDLQDMPQEEKHVVKRMMGMSMQMGGIVSPQLELMKK